jgi:uncharacterized protein (TIGR02246 family)
VNRPLFPSPQDAEAAFYEAFTKSDLKAMMAVWADDDDIYCVHPHGARVSGVEQVRESWRQIFASGQSLRFQLRGQQFINAMMVSVHSVYEHITVAGDTRSGAPVIATNVYLRTDRGWRMVAHHASPAPAATGEETQSMKNTLH